MARLKMCRWCGSYNTHGPHGMAWRRGCGGDEHEACHQRECVPREPLNLPEPPGGNGTT